MYYEIKVEQAGSMLLTATTPPGLEDAARKAAKELRTRFPKAEGFRLSATCFGDKGGRRHLSAHESKQQLGVELS
jgi:hypothetical protein